MRYHRFILLILLVITSSARPSNKIDWIEARSWMQERVENDLDGQHDTEGADSYRKVAQGIWRDYSRRYRQLAELPLSNLSDKELRVAAELFITMASVGTNVARSSEQYPEVRKMAAAAVAVLAEITSRRQPTQEEAVLTYSAIFSLREWQLEKGLRGALHITPYIVDDPGVGTARSLWHLDPDFYTMKRVSYELTDDVKWIVIAFADCAVAREAVADITEDKQLREMFVDRSLWLTAPGSNSQSFPGVFVWNAKYPQFPLKFIHHMDEWPMLDMRPDSPTFVRVKDGQVVGMHAGWGTGKYLPAVREVLLDIEAKAQ
jgi:hypothetical protein